MLREAGAAEIHLRISSPPYRWPCYYGLDTGTRAELIAANLEVDEIREYLGADSLAYLSLDALKEATGAPGAGFCDACLTGDYPVPVPARFSKSVLERPSQAQPATPGITARSRPSRHPHRIRASRGPAPPAFLALATKASVRHLLAQLR